jgi:hypothetical protein
MSVESFIKAVRGHSEEINKFLTLRPELAVALQNDAVSIEKIYAIVPSFAELLDKYGLKDALREEYLASQEELSRSPSSLRMLAQVFGHPWQHVNLEKALADAVAATRVSLGLDRDCEKNGECGDCECDPADEAPISVGITPDGNLAYTVSDEPLTLQEEANFIDTLRGKSTPIPWKMLATASGVCLEGLIKDISMTEHDPVNKPKHYTSHPSGVECIEISEKLSFNLGNAFKYVFRRDDKENALQDVSKAEWYLKREIGRLEGLIDTMPASVELLIHPNLTNSDDRKIDKVIEAEKNPDAADYYAYLFHQAELHGPEDLDSLREALVSLQALIEEIKNQSE